MLLPLYFLNPNLQPYQLLYTDFSSTASMVFYTSHAVKISWQKYFISKTCFWWHCKLASIISSSKMRKQKANLIVYSVECLKKVDLKYALCIYYVHKFSGNVVINNISLGHWIPWPFHLSMCHSNFFATTLIHTSQLGPVNKICSGKTTFSLIPDIFKLYHHCPWAGWCVYM